MAVVAPQRIKILADVPTVSEVGLPALSDKVSTLYILAPAETPGPVITRINTAFQRVLKDRQFVERMDTSSSFFPLGEHTAAQAQQFAIEDYQAWFKMAKEIKGQK
jgi:tripartite-type tricarboxylate transporter receptor subunit TctC